MTVLHNDNTPLQPVTDFDSPALSFDFDGMRIGVAEYAEGPTGCTVLHFPAGVQTAVDVRSGYAAVCGGYEWCHAICLTGGALYGLEAAAGVSTELWAQTGYEIDAFPLVNGAAIYDFGVRSPANAIYPDKALGRAALRAAQPGKFLIGARGAGRSASNGSIFDDSWAEPSGQSAAFRQVGDVKIFVCVVNNSVAAVYDRAGKVVRGNRNPADVTRADVIEELERRLASRNENPSARRASNLTVVVTNAAMKPVELRQLGRQVHASLGRALYPFQTIDDNDVCYAVSTNEIADSPPLHWLGMVASELAWDAVLSCR